MRVSITNSRILDLRESLEQLLHYPYGCVEQTMSRFLPAVITAKTLADGKKPKDNGRYTLAVNSFLAAGQSGYTMLRTAPQVPDEMSDIEVMELFRDRFLLACRENTRLVDPKRFDEKSFVNFESDVCIIPPNSFALARTVEFFRIPRSTLVVCLGKSTYARCGIIVNVTPLEPEWEGHVTLEFSNTTPLPAKIYANEGVAQMLFFESDEVCETSYKDRGGKYQGQRGVTLPKA